MDCNETRRLLDAHLDGELDIVRDGELAAHLRVCPECARLAENARARHAVLHESLPRFAAPPRLAEKIRARLPVQTPVASARPKIVFPLWQLSGFAATVALALLAGFTWGSARSHANLVLDEAISDHVRSLQASHLTDVASSDQHTVKPWFAGKLDFSPPVVDLATAGFPLAGGRLEHLDGRSAAALVFRRRQHAINLFVWPANVTAISSSESERSGYQVATWSQDGLNFLAVSEIPATELAQFADSFRKGQR